MKKLLFAFMFCAFGAMAQPKESHNVVSLWKEYVKDCNELVSDTVIQSGTVTIRYLPVMEKGKVTHFISAPVDTTWNKVELPEYKNGTPKTSLRSFGSSLFSSAGYGTYATVSASNAVWRPYEEVVSNDRLYISRKQVGKVKKQKASFEDFFQRWLVEKKIIEFN